jgi:hypothetical protein
MHFLLSLPVVALSFFVAAAAANPHGNHARRHDAIARRAPGDISAHLQKRDFQGARWSFYDVGL